MSVWPLIALGSGLALTWLLSVEDKMPVMGPQVPPNDTRQTFTYEGLYTYCAAIPERTFDSRSLHGHSFILLFGKVGSKHLFAVYVQYVDGLYRPVYGGTLDSNGDVESVDTHSGEYDNDEAFMRMFYNLRETYSKTIRA